MIALGAASLLFVDVFANLVYRIPVIPLRKAFKRKNAGSGMNYLRTLKILMNQSTWGKDITIHLLSEVSKYE